MVKVYIIYLFIYAIIGWVMEVTYNGIRQGRYINCGVLNGPWCPIYGFAAVSILLFLKGLHIENKLILFFASMFIASVIELVTGFILEKVFHKKWWDYSDKRLNIGGYICAEYSLIWGALCFILFEAVQPMIARFVADLPRNLVIGVNIVIAILFVIDTIHTVNTILGINKKFKQIDKTSKRLSEFTNELGEKIAVRGIEAAQISSEKRAIFDERSKDFKKNFDKYGEKRILKAFPNLIKDLEDRAYNLRDGKEHKKG